MTYSLRVSEELKQLLVRTARHTGISVAEILKRTRRGIIRKRAVIPCGITAVYYKSGPDIIPVREFTLPDGCSPERFRRTLAARCLEALDKPPCKPLPDTGKIAGKDYVIITEQEE